MNALALRHRKVLSVTGLKLVNVDVRVGHCAGHQEVTIRLGGSSLNRPLIALER